MTHYPTRNSPTPLASQPRTSHLTSLAVEKVGEYPWYSENLELGTRKGTPLIFPYHVHFEWFSLTEQIDNQMSYNLIATNAM